MRHVSGSRQCVAVHFIEISKFVLTSKCAIAYRVVGIEITIHPPGHY